MRSKLKVISSSRNYFFWTMLLLIMAVAAACGGQASELSEEVPARRGDADVLVEVQDITAEVLGIPFEEVVEDADFRQDLGASEEQMAEIASIFEEAFAVELTEEEVNELTTVGSAVDLVVSKR